MSLRARVLQKIVTTYTRRADTGEPDIPKARRTVTAMECRFRLPADVTTSDRIIAGVPVRRFSSGSGAPGVVLYLHGGAYFCGSSNMGRRYAAIVAAGGPDMVGVDYRMAPEHPYPAALDDAYAVYRELSDAPVVVVGDSAGGGLALALTQRVRDAGLPMPAGLAPIFPWADLTQSGSSWATNAGRDMLTKDGLDWAAGIYAGDNDRRSPGVSPLFGSFDGFPQTLITVGTVDSLLDDARGVTAAMRTAGVDVVSREVAGATHGFTTLPTPEASEAIAAVAAFSRRCLS